MTLTLIVAVAIAAQATVGAISGVVLDTRGGTPLRRVAVRLQTTNRTVLTDEEGRFSFDDVAAGRQELYVSAVDFILVKRTVTVVAGETTDVTIALTEGTGTYTETVTVTGSDLRRAEATVAAERTLGSAELQQLRGVLANDPMRAVQVMPGVATGDDLRSEFAVRGLGVQQMLFTFEGISTAFLLHTVQQVHDAGSIAMVNGDVLEEVSLSSGAYPQRHGNRTGAALDFRMREGSRDRVKSHVAVSAIDASAVVEGPLGRSKRGSWLVTGRRSYLDLILRRIYRDQTVNFGFSDAQVKLAYDVTPRHQVQLAVTGGHSRLDLAKDELRNPSDLITAFNDSGLAVASWRYLPSSSFALTQRFAMAANAFRNTSRDGPILDDGHAHETVYRADWTFAAAARVTVEGGGEARWSTAAASERRLSGGRFVVRENFNDDAAGVSGYVQTRLASERGAAIVPGARVDHWSLTGDTAVSPWVQGVVPLTRALTLRGGGGIYRQEPAFGQLLGIRGTASLKPERAYHVDVGVDGRLGSTLRWQATLYDREDRDRLRLPNSEMRLINAALVNASTTTRYQNALDGCARGIEWLIERRTPNGLSGWASYAYGLNKYRDRGTGESFWGDFDQRHTLNVYGNYRVSDRLSFSARLRAGSNFPATGYWTARDGTYFVASARNTLRVPVYSRLDVRMNRTFTWERKRLTLFVEGLNIYDRRNVRYAIPSVNRRTFEVTNLFESMVPLVPSVGVLLEF